MRLPNPRHAKASRTDTPPREPWAAATLDSGTVSVAGFQVRVLLHHWPQSGLSSILRILRLDETGLEHECLVRPLASGSETLLAPRPLGSGIVFTFVDAGDLQLLYSTDLVEFRTLPTLPGAGARVGLVDFAGTTLLADLGAEGGLWRLDTPDDGAWQRLLLPAEIGPVQSAARFGDALWLASDQGAAGFSLWRGAAAEGGGGRFDWRRVLVQGAWRFSVNHAVTAMLPTADCLLVATAATGHWLHRLGNHGPELLAVYPDDRWEIVVGLPRFTPEGLKIPLAAVGPGFDDSRPAAITSLETTAAGGCVARKQLLDPGSGNISGQDREPELWQCGQDIAVWDIV